MNRVSIIGLALVAGALFAYGAVSGDEPARPLCQNGHPSPRRPDVTYGHLPVRPGRVRDHRIPLCLGGPDTAANIQYQTIGDASAKDILEWRMCEAYCSGKITLDKAQAFFASGKWEQVVRLKEQLP